MKWEIERDKDGFPVRMWWRSLRDDPKPERCTDGYQSRDRKLYRCKLDRGHLGLCEYERTLIEAIEDS